MSRSATSAWPTAMDHAPPYPKAPTAHELVASLTAETASIRIDRPKPPTVKLPLMTRLLGIIIVVLLGALAALAQVATEAVEGMIDGIQERRAAARVPPPVEIPAPHELIDERAFAATVKAKPEHARRFWCARAEAFAAAHRWEEADHCYRRGRLVEEGELKPADGIRHAEVLLRIRAFDRAQACIDLYSTAELGPKLSSRAIEIAAACHCAMIEPTR
jgi:hypothetical protein